MCVNPEEADVKEKIPGEELPVGPLVHQERKSAAWHIVSEDGSTSVWPQNFETDATGSLEAPSRHSTEAKPPCEMPRANPDLGDVLNEIDSSRESTVSGSASRGEPCQANVSIQMKPAELDDGLLRTIHAWPALSSQVRETITAIVEAAIADDRP